jgi:hypothetical protein
MCVVCCCAGGEFSEAVHYVANVWLPAKQVSVRLVQLSPTTAWHGLTPFMLASMLWIETHPALTCTCLHHIISGPVEKHTV